MVKSIKHAITITANLAKKSRKEDGAVALITAVIFMALVLMTGVVIDLGRLHMETSHLQTADNLINTIAYNGAQDVLIKYGAGDGDTGFYGALDLDGVKGGGANEYTQWLNYGYYGSIETGDMLYTEPGNMDGPTQTAFADRYNSCTHFSGEGGCTPEHFDPDCPRVIYIIVYDQISSDSVEVKGFAPFVLTGITEDSEITASLIDVQLKSAQTEAADATSINYGLYAVRLIE